MDSDPSAGRWLGLIGEDQLEVGIERQAALPGDWEVVYEDPAVLTIVNSRPFTFETEPGVRIRGLAVWASCAGGEPLRVWDGLIDLDGSDVAIVDTHRLKIWVDCLLPGLGPFC